MTIEDFYKANRFAEVFLVYRHRYDKAEPPLRFKDLVTEHALAIERNYNIAQEIQQKIFERETIQEGDAITINGVIRGFVTNDLYQNKTESALQAFGGVLSMNHHRNPHGGGSYSGVCGDVFKYKKTIDTEMHIRSTGWFWADNSAGGGKGLDYAFQVKIWKLYV